MDKTKPLHKKSNQKDEVSIAASGIMAEVKSSSSAKSKIPNRKDIPACQKYMRKRIKRAVRYKEKNGKFASLYRCQNQVMMRVVYKFVRAYLKADEGDELFDEANRFGVMSKTRPSTNPFNTGFLLLLAKGAISNQDRFRYSKQLSYAYEHGVEPKWLPGFLSQAGGGDRVIAKYEAGKFEPWLKTRPKHPLRT
ncbi:MAG: hypothetical protein COA84_01580 [Robiginitomaculum sp.]|nr:MAG: hypothetical protein COA84_01580 [Robiginitomaculum sp.]